MDNQNLPPQAKDPTIQTERVDKAIEQNLSGGRKIVNILKQRKILLFVPLLVIIIVLSVVILNRGQKNLDEVNQQAVPTTESLKKQYGDRFISIPEVSKEIVDYLKTQKRPDGYNNYITHFDELCPDKTKCILGSKNVYPLNNTWTALANFANYKISQDRAYLELANKELEALYDYCPKNKDECLWGLAQPAIIYQDTKDPKILDFLKQQGELLLKTSDPTSLMILNIEVRQLALLFGITQDNRYLQESIKRFNSATSNLVRNESTNRPKSEGSPVQVCWYYLAGVELSNVTKNPTYINQIKSRLDEGEIDSMYNHPFAVNIEPCVEAWFLASEVGNNKPYINDAYKLLLHLKNNFWDTKTSPIVWGEGGVVATNPKSEVQPEILKKEVNTTDSSYMVYLLYLAQKYSSR